MQSPQTAPRTAPPQWFDASIQKALDDLVAAARAGGRGVSALFRGPAGSGKTVAAHLLASSLARDVIHVHLSQVVSRTIGETEKNLQTLFDRAETAGAVLLFDEADALFGARMQVQDARDRDADTEIAVLLRQIENFRGVAILESRIDWNFDEAMRRRLRAVVRFVER